MAKQGKKNIVANVKELIADNKKGANGTKTPGILFYLVSKKKKRSNRYILFKI